MVFLSKQIYPIHVHVFHGFSYIFTDFRGFPWISTDFHGFIWIYMDFHGLALLSIDFERSRGQNVLHPVAACATLCHRLDPPIIKISDSRGLDLEARCLDVWMLEGLEWIGK